MFKTGLVCQLTCMLLRPYWTAWVCPQGRIHNQFSVYLSIWARNWPVSLVATWVTFIPLYLLFNTRQWASSMCTLSFVYHFFHLICWRFLEADRSLQLFDINVPIRTKDCVKSCTESWLHRQKYHDLPCERNGVTVSLTVGINFRMSVKEDLTISLQHKHKCSQLLSVMSKQYV